MQVYTAGFSGGSLGKNAGCSSAPAAILRKIPNFTAELRPVQIQRQDIAVFPTDFPATLLSIAQGVHFPCVVLGGDHSITYATFSAFAAKHPGAALAVLDAHADLMQPFSVPTHENYLRMLIEEGKLLPQNLVLIGVRNWDKEEVAFAKASNLRIYTAAECMDNMQEVCDAAMAYVKDAPAIFISVDIDCADPAYAPGTGYPEPGGLSGAQVLYLVRRLRKLKRFAGADIVEVNPELDKEGRTVQLASSVLAELAADAP